MSIGDTWWVYWTSTNQWRPAEIINESGERVELRFIDAPNEPDLQKTISKTRAEMNNPSRFKRR